MPVWSQNNGTATTATVTVTSNLTGSITSAATAGVYTLSTVTMGTAWGWGTVNYFTPQIWLSAHPVYGQRTGRVDYVASLNPYEDYWKGRAAEREIAEARAEMLLRTHLNPIQRDQYDKHGWFIVVGGKTDRRYRINKGRHANIDVLSGDGRVVHSLCGHPKVMCPHQDTMLAQKLQLELCEHEFVAMSNKHNVSHAWRNQYAAPDAHMALLGG